MNVLICAGGTGPRVLESLVHMSCAGVGPKEITLLMIDADQANGNTNRLNRLFESYYKINGLLESTGFFNTQFDFLTEQDNISSFHHPRIYSPVQGNEKLREIINYNGLDATDTPPELADVFFKRKSELDLELNVGFRGHPAIGAAALSLTNRFDENPIWQLLIQKIRTKAQNETQPVKICIVGSVFGGTGASTFEPLSRFLSKTFQPEIQQERVDIGAVFLTPYFQYVAQENEGEHARAERFAIATRAAVEFYQHLRENNELNFSSMYWLGDRSLMQVPFSNGGPRQENPAHPLELLTAMVIKHFFDSPKLDQVCIYTGPSQNSHPDLGRYNPFSWQDLPFDVEQRSWYSKGFLSLYRFAIVHNYFYFPLFNDPEFRNKQHYLPWIVDHQLSSLLNNENMEKMQLVKNHFEQFYFNWIRQLSNPEYLNGRFFNLFPLQFISDDVKITLKLCNNLDWTPPNSQGKEDSEAIYNIVTKMCMSRSSSGRDLIRYFNLLKEATYY